VLVAPIMVRPASAFARHPAFGHAWRGWQTAANHDAQAGDAQPCRGGRRAL